MRRQRVEASGLSKGLGLGRVSLRIERGGLGEAGGRLQREGACAYSELSHTAE